MNVPGKHLGCILAGILLLAAGQAPLPAQSPVEVALYRDTGTWTPEVDNALPALLTWLNLPFHHLTADDIKAGKLLKNGKPAYRLLIVPGGWAPSYIVKLGGWGHRGGDDIKAFLQAGGHYLGFCAGAFAACATVKWEGKNYNYPWKLFDGQGTGPLPWNPSRQGALTHTHGTALIQRTAPLLAAHDVPERIRPLLAGGPGFTLRDPKNPPPAFEVLARHGEDNSLAILAFRYPTKEDGRVVLCAFHPAVLTDDNGAYDRDRTDHKALGAGADPDGDYPDWCLAAALIEGTLGRKPGPRPHLLGFEIR